MILRPGTSTLRPCSENQVSSCSVGKLKKWLSSPIITASCKALTSSKRFSVEGTEIGNCVVSSNGLDESKSPFLTPPSLPYAPNESISGVISGETISDQSDTRQHRKVCLGAKISIGE